MTKPYESPCYRTNIRWCDAMLTSYYDRMMAPCELSAQQYYMLINLKRMESANITAWANAIGLERSTMVRNCRVLEKHGWIRQTEGHGKAFALTEKGENALATGANYWNEAQQVVRSILGDEDIAAIFRITEKLEKLREV